MTDKLRAEWFWVDRWTTSSGALLPMPARCLYREMLSQAWIRGAKLPNNHEQIQRAVHCTADEWDNLWPFVERYWRVEGDDLVNDTQREIYAEALAQQTKARERAQSAANQRWHPNNNGNGHHEHEPEKPEKTPKKPRGSHRPPTDFHLTEDRLAFAIGDGLDQVSAEREFEKFKDCEFRTARTDWDAAWRNWIRTATQRQNMPPRAWKDAPASRPQPPSARDVFKKWETT